VETIELSDFIAELREELGKAISAGKDAELRFVAKAVELELQVAAESKNDGSGKLSFKVFGIGLDGGGGRSTSATATHKITLSLNLVDRHGNTPFISAKSENTNPA
jgi:hypothetical protein